VYTSTSYLLLSESLPSIPHHLFPARSPTVHPSLCTSSCPFRFQPRIFSKQIPLFYSPSYTYTYTYTSTYTSASTYTFTHSISSYKHPFSLPFCRCRVISVSIYSRLHFRTAAEPWTTPQLRPPNPIALLKPSQSLIRPRRTVVAPKQVDPQTNPTTRLPQLYNRSSLQTIAINALTTRCALTHLAGQVPYIVLRLRLFTSPLIL
jgi:hypothetical protein